MTDDAISRDARPSLSRGLVGRLTGWGVASTRAGEARATQVRDFDQAPGRAVSHERRVAPGSSQPKASCSRTRRRASPLDSVIYSNGPVNGTVDAWTINYGYVVANSLHAWQPQYGQRIRLPRLGVSRRHPLTVDWSITSDPLAVPRYGSGTASVTSTFISSNQYGYDIDKISASGLNVTVTPGSTYWINLQNASVPSGDPVFWDENSGVGCQSQGCPSQAVESAVGTIPSEAFDVTTNASTAASRHHLPALVQEGVCRSSTTSPTTRAPTPRRA